MVPPLDDPGRDHAPERLPPRLAAILRPELDSLAEDIVKEISTSIPEYAEYAEPAGNPYRPTLRISVEQALATFVDQISGSTESRERRDELCRALGRGEAHEGRSLDALQSAYRTGVRLAWRRVAEVGRRRGLSPRVMSRLAGELFAYIDELASLSVEGYLEARSRSADEQAERRRRLLGLILRCPPAAGSSLTGPAREAGWDLPGEVTLIALPAQAGCAPGALHRDVLADLAAPEPFLLVPGPLDDARRAMLLAALPERRAAAGLTVPLTGAADSLRWARRTLALVEAGILEDAGLTSCEDHLLELWLLSDEALLGQVTRRRLVALAGMGGTQRDRLSETLGAWLETQGNAVDAAGRLRVHPQTVRYRMRQVNELFHDQLANSDGRFTLEVVLRAARLRERRASLR